MLKFAMFAIICLAIAVIAVLLLAATRPDTFQVQRTATIKATPARVFSYINNLHQWHSWSPYDALDPQMKRSYLGPDEGPGARLEWEGNSKAGAGRAEITDSSAPDRVGVTMEMIRPFEARNRVEFTLVAKGDRTDVTWAMSGPSPYFGKVMGLFGLMDRIIGKEFETGLANLKSIAER